MSDPSTGVLHGLCILNTRPAHQQADLQALLEADGARVLSFPSIEIVTVEPTAFHQNLATKIEQYQIAIFVSRNAVDGAFEFLGTDSLPQDLKLAVIGEGTYQALAKKVVDLDRRLIRSEPYNSEGLLTAEALQRVDGKNILIFRGQQGRTLLSETLGERGAIVDHCEVYRRRAPNYAAAEFPRLCAGSFPSLVLFTSSEGMSNLVGLLDESSRLNLLSCPWLLISERMRESAVNLGHNAVIIIAPKASDAGIHQAICEWAQRNKTNL